MCLMFSDRSMYVQITTKRFKEEYLNNFVYRFLNNSRINWERFTTLLSERIVNILCAHSWKKDKQAIQSQTDIDKSKKLCYNKTYVAIQLF